VNRNVSLSRGSGSAKRRSAAPHLLSERFKLQQCTVNKCYCFGDSSAEKLKRKSLRDPRRGKMGKLWAARVLG